MKTTENETNLQKKPTNIETDSGAEWPSAPSTARTVVLSLDFLPDRKFHRRLSPKQQQQQKE